ncbi:MAG: hypothetical protein ACFFD4_33235 [Candidatus Odinarchaeota archaeon]
MIFDKPSFDITVPRYMFWSDMIPSPSSCPLCKSELRDELATYLMVLKYKSGHDTSNFFHWGSCGSICPNCPTIVLDPGMLFFSAEDTCMQKGRQLDDFLVAGLVDVIMNSEGEIDHKSCKLYHFKNIADNGIWSTRLAADSGKSSAKKWATIFSNVAKEAREKSVKDEKGDWGLPVTAVSKKKREPWYKRENLGGGGSKRKNKRRGKSRRR